MGVHPGGRTPITCYRGNDVSALVRYKPAGEFTTEFCTRGYCRGDIRNSWVLSDVDYPCIVTREGLLCGKCREGYALTSYYTVRRRLAGVFLPLDPSLHLSLSLSLCLCICLCVYPSLDPSLICLCLCVSASVCVCIHLCLCISVSLCLHLSLCRCLCIFLCLCICLSLSLSLSLCLCLSFSASVSVSVSLRFSVSLYLSFSVSFSVSVSVSLYLFISLGLYLCFCLCVSLSVSLSLSIYQSILPSIRPSNHLSLPLYFSLSKCIVGKYSTERASVARSCILMLD